MKLLTVVGKFLLICGLLIGLFTLVGSAIGLYFGLFDGMILRTIHLWAGSFFVLFALIHFIHRRRKWRKLITQTQDVLFTQKYPSYCNLDRLLMTFENVSVVTLADTLQLPLETLLLEFQQGKIAISDPDKTLRYLVGENDEKLFSAITIAMNLRFNYLTEKHE